MARAGAIISAARRGFGERNRTAISSECFRRDESLSIEAARGEHLRERRAKAGLTGRYLRTTRLLNLWGKAGERENFRERKREHVLHPARNGREFSARGEARRLALLQLCCVYPAVYLSAV